MSELIQTGICAIIRSQAGITAIETLADALYQGGIRVMEVSFTTPQAAALIKRIKQHLGHKLVTGAGTILNLAAAQEATAAGADFLVSPVLKIDVVAWCRQRQIGIIPGVFSPTEILTAWESGAELVKVYPANLGGPGYIRSLKNGPLPQIRYMPVGGVNLENTQTFIAAGADAVGVGDSLVNDRIIAAQDWSALTGKATEYIAAVTRGRESHG